MSDKKPLLFIQSPVIRKFHPPPEEESTSVFEPCRTNSVERDLTLPEAAEEPQTDPHILQRLNFLHHPFRKEIYQPIEIITEELTVKGKMHKIEGQLLWMEKNGELISVAVSEVRDIKWKQQSFII